MVVMLFVQDPQASVISPHELRRLGLSTEGFIQGLERDQEKREPPAERRGWNPETGAGIDLTEMVERDMVVELTYDQVCQKPRTGESLLDRLVGCWGSHHPLLTAFAGTLGPFIDDDDKGGRPVFDHLAGLDPHDRLLFPACFARPLVLRDIASTHDGLVALGNCESSASGARLLVSLLQFLETFYFLAKRLVCTGSAET